MQQPAAKTAGLSITGQGEFLLYQTEDAKTLVQVRFVDGGIWLTQAQLAELYQSTPQNITQHIRAIYGTRELQEEATCKPYLQVRQERGRQVSRSLKHYNLDMVLAIGYRAKSHRGTQFRRWATEQLKTYLSKGILLDDALRRFRTLSVPAAEVRFGHRAALRHHPGARRIEVVQARQAATTRYSVAYFASWSTTLRDFRSPKFIKLVTVCSSLTMPRRLGMTEIVEAQTLQPGPF